MQMLKILVIRLLGNFFNIEPKWFHSLKRAAPVVFPFRQLRWVSIIDKGSGDIL